MKAADWRAVQKQGWRSQARALAPAACRHGGARHRPRRLRRGQQGHRGNPGRALRLDVEEANRQEARVERLVAEHEAPLNIAENAERPPCRFCRHGRSASRRRCRGGTAGAACTSPLAATATGTARGSTSRAARSASRRARTARLHLFLPALVPGEQIDADPEAETVTYRMRDGAIWVDGATEEAA